MTTLRRTVQTAAPLAARLGIEPWVEPDLREVHLGEWEGEIYRQRVAEGHPLATRCSSSSAGTSSPAPSPPHRCVHAPRGAVSGSSPPTPTSVVAVFSHGGVIAEILAQVADTNRPFAFLGCDNASISQIVAFGGRWILRRFNDTAHLDVVRPGDLDPEPHLPES